MCGGTLYRAGSLRRDTYRPSLDGSLANTVTCAPFGNAGGAGPHFNWSAETATWSSAAIAGIDAKPATNNVVTKTIRNMLTSQLFSLCPVKLPHRDTKKKAALVASIAAS